jgi:hypothetical protein
MFHRSFALAAVCSFLFPTTGSTQTKSHVPDPMNPAISVVARSLVEAAPDLDRSFGLMFQEAEIIAKSSVDPHWDLTAIFVFADEEVAAEEVFATTTSLQDIQFKLGKMKVAFGKHGLLHGHAFPFIQAPIVLMNTLGEEGFNDSGVEASWLTPLPWSCELTGGVYRSVEVGDRNPLDLGSPDHWNLPWLGHLKNIFDLSEGTTLEFGLSTLTGQGIDGFTHAVYGGDITLKNMPTHEDDQRGWILQGEYLKKVSFGGGSFAQEQDGWYASFQYRLGQLGWVGIRMEEAFQSVATALTDGMGDPLAGHIQRASLHLAWSLSEFSTIRGGYSLERVDTKTGESPFDNHIMGQFIFLIGAHPTHAH